MHEGWMQTGWRTADAGSRLKPADHPGRHRLDSQPSSRTGENSPYGMIGGIEETSASFEARSAPRSYPTSPLCSPFHWSQRLVGQFALWTFKRAQIGTSKAGLDTDQHHANFALGAAM